MESTAQDASIVILGTKPYGIATAEHVQQAAEIFEASGVVIEIPEALQDAVSAISGSGPAYVFYLTEAMASAARSLGIDPETAAVLARQTVIGAGTL